MQFLNAHHTITLLFHFLIDYTMFLYIIHRNWWERDAIIQKAFVIHNRSHIVLIYSFIGKLQSARGVKQCSSKSAQESFLFGCEQRLPSSRSLILLSFGPHCDKRVKDSHLELIYARFCSFPLRLTLLKKLERTSQAWPPVPSPLLSTIALKSRLWKSWKSKNVSLSLFKHGRVASSP